MNSKDTSLRGSSWVTPKADTNNPSNSIIVPGTWLRQIRNYKPTDLSSQTSSLGWPPVFVQKSTRTLQEFSCDTLYNSPFLCVLIKGLPIPEYHSHRRGFQGVL